MKHTILFSGGLDSTYLIQKKLEDDSINELQLFTIKLHNNDEFMEPNELSRELIKNELKRLYPHKKISIIENEMTFYFTDKFKLDNQAFIWTYNVAHSLFNTNVYVGYIIDDNVTPNLLKDTQTIINIINRNKIPNSTVKLKYPLIKFNKRRIFDSINTNLRELVISCQNPIKMDKYWISCGKCNSCKLDMKYEIFQPKLFDTENKNIRILNSEELVKSIDSNIADLNIIKCYIHYLVKGYSPNLSLTKIISTNNMKIFESLFELNDNIFTKERQQIIRYYIDNTKEIINE